MIWDDMVEINDQRIPILPVKWSLIFVFMLETFSSFQTAFMQSQGIQMTKTDKGEKKNYVWIQWQPVQQMHDHKVKSSPKS